MAAVDPSESPKRQKSPAEEVEKCGGRSEAVESGCDSKRGAETTCSQTAGSPDVEQRARVCNDGGGCVASHSEVSVESGAGADKTTCNSPKDLTLAEKMAEASGGDQRDDDWSETEDNVAEAKRRRQGKDKCGRLTLLMFFTVSFSVQANVYWAVALSKGSLHPVNSDVIDLKPSGHPAPLCLLAVGGCLRRSRFVCVCINR